MSYSHGQTVRAADYNALAGLTGTAAANDAAATEVAGYLFGVGYGSRGYGQSTPALTAHSTGSVIPAWTNLRTVLSTLCSWQNTSITDLPSSGAVAGGAVIAVTDIPDLLSLLDTNRLNYQVGNMTLTASAATSARATSWSDTITAEFSVTFANENAARFFFNTGGEIRIALDHPEEGTPQDTDWHDVLENLVVAFRAMETVRLSGSTGTATGVGYYDLTSSYQTILDGTNVGSGAYSSNDYLIEAKALSITGLNGAKGSEIWFRVTLTDQHANVHFDQVADGTVVTLSHLRASAVLSTLPAAPTCAVETDFDD